VRIVTPDDGDVVAAMARLSAAVEGAENRPEEPRKEPAARRPPPPAEQDAPVAEIAIAAEPGDTEHIDQEEM
jgi:hypothetical protein